MVHIPLLPEPSYQSLVTAGPVAQHSRAAGRVLAVSAAFVGARVCCMSTGRFRKTDP
jgi:hypothetical protein